ERHAAVSRAAVHTASTAKHTDNGSSTMPGAGSPAVGMPAAMFDVAWTTWPAERSDTGSAEDAELCEGVRWVGWPKECIVTTPNRTADNRARRTAQATHLCLPVLTTCLPVCGLLPGGYPGGVDPSGPAMGVPGEVGACPLAAGGVTWRGVPADSPAGSRPRRPPAAAGQGPDHRVARPAARKGPPRRRRPHHAGGAAGRRSTAASGTSGPTPCACCRL